jgi:hypothetical protein
MDQHSIDYLNHSEAPARDSGPRSRQLTAAVAGLAVATAAAAPFLSALPHVVGRIALNHNEVAGA